MQTNNTKVTYLCFRQRNDVFQSNSNNGRRFAVLLIVDMQNDQKTTNCEHIDFVINETHGLNANKEYKSGLPVV
jgi:hypothetical protein